MHQKSQRSTSSRSYRGTIRLPERAPRLELPGELPPRLEGSDKLARYQRARIYGGMIEAVSRHGYKSTTVADVIALAGVSRRAFYEQFSNKEDCFLATYDIVVARARKRVLQAWMAERGWDNRLHGATKALLDHIAGSPTEPRLVLFDSFALGPRARERMALSGSAFERLVATGFSLKPSGIDLAPLAPRAIVGGVRRVISTRLLEGREHELSTLTDEVLDWMGSYQTTKVSHLRVPGPTLPHPQPHSSAEFLTRDDRRARILNAIVRLTLDEGYAGLTDEQIAQFGGVSVEAFHAQFPSKQECFLAVLDEFVEEALGRAREQLRSADGWRQGTYHAIASFVEYLATHEALARIAFIEAFELGQVIARRLERPIGELVKLLVTTAPDPRHGPEIADEAITGALWTIIASMTSGRPERLMQIVDPLAFFVLAPYVGPKSAIDAIQAARKSLRAV